MIRINLLPVRHVRKQEAGRNQLILFGLVLVGAGIANYYWYADRKGASDKLAAQVSAVQKEIADLDRIIGEVKTVEEDKKKLQEKLKVLDTLKKGRTGPVKMLDAMASAIPKNVWLRALTEVNGAMTLDGSALSNDDVAEFMKALSGISWTPEGMGRVVEAARKGNATARVELMPSGQIKDVAADQVSAFFKNVQLKKTTQKTGGKDDKTVDFTLAMTANYTI
jgi:type IV pilus assembly protein PilN